MNDHQAYLSLVTNILSSGLPNYRSVCVPLPSVFSGEYLRKHVDSYHDGRLNDYLKFGFPLGIASKEFIKSNAVDYHSSSNAYMNKVDAFFEKEIEEGALVGPIDHKPHPAFTWSPLMNRLKGPGRRVISDLSSTFN